MLIIIISRGVCFDSEIFAKYSRMLAYEWNTISTFAYNPVTVYGPTISNSSDWNPSSKLRNYTIDGVKFHTFILLIERLNMVEHAATVVRWMVYEEAKKGTVMKCNGSFHLVRANAAVDWFCSSNFAVHTAFRPPSRHIFLQVMFDFICIIIHGNKLVCKVGNKWTRIHEYKPCQWHGI